MSSSWSSFFSITVTVWSYAISSIRCSLLSFFIKELSFRFPTTWPVFQRYSVQLANWLEHFTDHDISIFPMFYSVDRRATWQSLKYWPSRFVKNSERTECMTFSSIWTTPPICPPFMLLQRTWLWTFWFKRCMYYCSHHKRLKKSSLSSPIC